MLERDHIARLLRELDQELAATSTVGEIYLMGGAVMTLVLNARPSTNDLDAYFQPASIVREAAARVGARHALDPGWLNDAVKGFLSASGTFSTYWESKNLRVFTATPEYLLAMKCLSMRLGPEFHDESDVRFLLRYLNLSQLEDAYAIIGRYYPIERFPQKTLYALEELLAEAKAP
jgi:hypothetical protein